MELENGKVILTGFCDATFYVGWNNEEVEGHIVQINGKNYACYVDPDDGYRSYSSFFETDEPCTRTFPPQEVEYEEISEEGGYDWYEEPKRSGMMLSNIDTKEVILYISTVWHDGYYPTGVVHWHPENLPINKERNAYEGCTFTIIAEWKRINGEHVIIGKMEDGNYIEGVISEDGLRFGPITDFKIINPLNN